jgi:arylsulfatase A-like enzyme
MRVSQLKERKRLACLLMIAIASVTAVTSCSHAPPGAYESTGYSRPNILFILTDDQRWDAMSCMGHPFVRTPNMDRIAREGIRFENAFVTTSLCSPSRATFLTGAYAHTHGVVTNESNDPDPGIPIFPAILRDHGYDTAFIGKWHMKPTSEPRPGFDYWLSFRGQGTYTDPHLNENGREFQASGYMTDLLTDYALRWLEQPRTRPFCLILSHKAVHGPFTPAPRHRDEFQDVVMAEPPNFRDTFAGKPAWLRRVIAYGQQRGRWILSQDSPIPEVIPPGEWNPRNPGWLNYFRALLAVDEGIGQVLEALEEKGQLDRTVVVFAGDNGFFHGEHRRGDKRLIYEESVRIPFLVRYPPMVEGGRTDPHLVLNLDLAPTLLDLAGVPIPGTVQGRSLRPLLEGREVPWRQSFLYEYFREAWLPGIPLTLGVRTDRWKYATYPDLDDISELYDLQTDSSELDNLSQNQAHAETLAMIQAELAALLERTGYPVGEHPGASAEVPSLRPDEPERIVLEYTWEEDRESTATDQSSFGHHGELHGTALVSGATWTARSFQGEDFIEVERSETLDPSLGPWTVEAWVSPSSPTGVVLAHGGESQGYAITIEAGKPSFHVRMDGHPNAVEGEESIVGRWTHLAGVISGSSEISLYVHGELAGSTRTGGLIGVNPSECLAIGKDLGTCVGTYADLPGLVGLIGPVRIFAGERTPGQIAGDAAGNECHTK